MLQNLIPISNADTRPSLPCTCCDMAQFTD